MNLNTLDNFTTTQREQYLNYVREYKKKYNLNTERAWRNFRVRVNKYLAKLEEK